MFEKQINDAWAKLRAENVISEVSQWKVKDVLRELAESVANAVPQPKAAAKPEAPKES